MLASTLIKRISYFSEHRSCKYISALSSVQISCFFFCFIFNHLWEELPGHPGWILLLILQWIWPTHDGSLRYISNPLRANPTKWSNTLCQQISWVCLTILWDWCLRGLIKYLVHLVIMIVFLIDSSRNIQFDHF